MVLFLTLLLKVYAAEGYSCLGYPKVYDATIDQHFYVIKDALSEGESKTRLFQDVVRHQNLHTFPNMHIFQDNNSVLHGNYDLQKLETKILSQEEISAPFEYYLDEMLPPPYFSKEVQEYLKRVKALKDGAKNRKLLKVSYSLKTNLTLCQKDDISLSTLKLPQPLDPWLTYFQIDPKLKVDREIVYLGKQRVNPCSTRPLIEPEGGQAFWGMWYFWSPFQMNSGTEADFDCSKLYQKDLHWRYADVSLKPQQVKLLTPDLGQLRNKNKLHMSFIFSSFKAKAFKKMEGELAQKIDHTYKKILGNLDFAQARNLLATNFSGQDESLTMVGIFLFNLSQNTLLKKSKLEMNDYFLKLDIEGILKLSAKPFKMSVFLSTNKPEHGSYEPFNNEIARSLIEDDVVTVTTHSVFGEAISLALKKSRENANSSKRPDYQFIAILSCLAKSYFPTGVFPKTQKHQTIDYIYSLTTLTELRGIGALTMIGMVDHSMRFGQAPPFESWLKNSRYNNFLSFEKVRGQ
jgi:hypothetical protein